MPTSRRLELRHLLDDVELEYRLVTETGIGDWSTLRLGDHLDAASVAAQMSTIAIYMDHTRPCRAVVLAVSRGIALRGAASESTNRGDLPGSDEEQ
jgi:hypothetical protein